MLKLESLNAAQRTAVMHGAGPLLVLAGPGSGKTFTITQRILYLLLEQRVPPENILVITFTREAAQSMQNRFTEQSTQNYPVNFGTFHSIFFHILKESNLLPSKQLLQNHQKRRLILPILKKYQSMEQNAHNQGTDSNHISVIPQAATDHIMKNQAVTDHIMKNPSITAHTTTANITKTNSAAHISSPQEDVDTILSAIGYYKNTEDMEAAMSKAPPAYQHFFRDIFKEYERERSSQGGIDFDDMVYLCREELVRNKALRAYWQSRFSHILIDEFQDINPMQYQVIKLLAGRECTIFAVGDDDQAIYGFRGSKPACLKQFKEEFHAREIFLDTNYRSREDIIRAATLLIEENRDRLPKPMQKAFQGKGNAGARVMLRAFTEQEDEKAYLLEQLKEAEHGRKQGESHAVLFRTNARMQGFAIALQREGIAFHMKEKSDSIYEHFICKDIMCYLKLAQGQCSRAEFLQIINKPSRFISREAVPEGIINMEDIRAYYRNRQDMPYYQNIIKAIDTLERQIQYLKKASPFLAVHYIRKAIGYEKYLGSIIGGNPEKKEGCEAVLQFLTGDAAEYEDIESWIGAQRAYNTALKQKGAEKEKTVDAVTGQEQPRLSIMTVHASKGLEFDRVWIPDCNEKVFPHGQMPNGSAGEEERRIFYVAVTRAKETLELLYLTGTKERPRVPSRFLNPLLEDYSSTNSSNSQLSKYSSKASATFSYSSSSSIKPNSGSSLGSSGFSL